MHYRYGAAALAAGGVTALVLLIMTLLIASGEVAATATEPLQLPLASTALPPPPPKTIFEPPKRPPPPERVPSGGPPVPVDGPEKTMTVPLPPGPPGPQPPSGSGEPPGVAPMAGDSPLVEIMSVRPQYPSRMLARGTQGWAVVVFDVDAAGQVVNPRVESSSHSGFERAALDAIARFRYQPQVVDGTPRGARQLRKQFTFDMEQD